MGARIVIGRQGLPQEQRAPETSPGAWIASTEGLMVKMPPNWTAGEVVDWCKLHFPEALLIQAVEDDGTMFQWRFRGVTDFAKNSTMAQFLDDVQRATYGRSRYESINKKVCVMCGRSDLSQSFRSPKNLDEYLISGLCGDCQLKVYGPEES